MTTNKDDFYLKNIGLLKQLEPIMKKKGIEDDEQWLYIPSQDQYILLEHIDNYEASSLVFMEKAIKIKTWRKDSLEAALPEWCFEMECDGESKGYPRDQEYDFYLWNERLREITTGEIGVDPETHAITGVNYELRGQMMDLINIALLKRGQKSLEALAQLIILLDTHLADEVSMDAPSGAKEGVE